MASAADTMQTSSLSLQNQIPCIPVNWAEAMLEDITAHAPVPNLSVKLGLYNDIDVSLPLSEICDRAVLAVKSIKHDYKRPYDSYDGAVSQQLYKAQMLEARFHSALKNKEFVVWYQPKFEPVHKTLLGAEALVRWKQKDGRIMPPGEFLPVFEKDGLIGQLDAYVFEEVCIFQQFCLSEGIPVLPVSVNLSRSSIFGKDIVERYQKIADQYNVPVSCVPIEITESAFIRSNEVKPVADAFVKAGFELHMDDFGSGRSSLNGLNVLPFSEVKFDKSLIDYIGDAQGDKVLKHTMALMDDLGLRTIAEGVETEAQKEFLIQCGVDGIHGYLFAKPMEESEYLKLLQ